jgi:hypothetical protein
MGRGLTRATNLSMYIHTPLASELVHQKYCEAKFFDGREQSNRTHILALVKHPLKISLLQKLEFSHALHISETRELCLMCNIRTNDMNTGGGEPTPIAPKDRERGWEEEEEGEEKKE